jgi:hypothetical protein
LARWQASDGIQRFDNILSYKANKIVFEENLVEQSGLPIAHSAQPER